MKWNNERKEGIEKCWFTILLMMLIDGGSSGEIGEDVSSVLALNL